MTAPLLTVCPERTCPIGAVDMDRLCADLVGQGWSLQDMTAHTALLSALAAEVARLRAENELTPAAVGRSDDRQMARSIRRDRIAWLDAATASHAAYLAFADGLREALNRRLMLGLFRYEAHFALYETGGFYRTHLDSFRGARNRIVSTVLYLNEDWRREDGGLLRLYDAAGAQVLQDVIPAMGTLAVFLSEDVPHEVTLAARPRASIAGWFRCNDLLETPALQGAGLAERL